VTLELTAYAALLILLIGIPLGILSAAFRSRGFDFAASTFSLMMGSIPAYVTGIVLIVVFAVEAKLLPAFGTGSGFTGSIRHLTLPAVALALSAIALISRTTRIAMIQSLESEYVEAARIRGLSESRVLLKHGLRGALIPVITIGGVVVGYLLSGAILVEYVFGLDGVGMLLVRSVQALDYPVVQAIALIITAEFLLINLIVDLLYGVIDPRVRLRPEAAGARR
jgi:peptide/nickel transport system permease protein